MNPAPTGPSHAFRVFRFASLLALLIGTAPELAGQGRSAWGAQVVGTGGRFASVVAGPGHAHRVGFRDRVTFVLALGASGHNLAGRGEAAWQFLLLPDRRSGPGPYLTGGLAAQADRKVRGWVLLGVGAEWYRRGRRTWAIEAGIGGGVRLSVARWW